MEKIIILLWAFITRGKAVYLEDNEEDTYLTIARKNGFGKMSAKVHFWFGVGHVILKDDGTIGGKSRYIKRWKYYNK